MRAARRLLGAKTGPLAIAFRDSASSAGAATTASLTIPGTVQVGDGMLVGLMMNDTTTVPTTPAGWTLVDHVTNAGGNGANISVYSKVAAGGDAGSTLTLTLNVNSRFAMTLTAYSGTSTIALVNAHANQSSVAGTTGTAPSVTTTTDGCWIVEVFGATSGASSTNTVTGPATQRVAPAAASNFVGACVSDQPQVSAGASGTNTATAVSSVWAAVTVAIAHA